MFTCNIVDYDYNVCVSYVHRNKGLELLLAGGIVQEEPYVLVLDEQVLAVEI